MADDAVYSDLLDALSPLTKAGIDPDDARMDRAGTMAQLLGPDDTPEPNWADKARAEYDDQQQQAAPTPSQGDTPAPQLSPNGNPLPQGLNSRQTAPTPAVPASVTPSGNATKPDLAAGNAATIGAMQQDYLRASKDVQNEAAQPDLAAQTAVLERQRANAQARQVELMNPDDPQTGKMRPEYKPSFGQRLVRGVEGFAGGGVLGVIDPRVGGAKPYGAPNKEFGIDQQQAAARTAGADQALANAASNWKATSDRLGKIAADRRALATTGKDVTGASTQQQQIPIDQQKADTGTAEAYNTSPEGKAEAAKELNAQTLSDRRAQLTDPKNPISRASAADKAYFVAMGKLPDPDRFHAPPEQVLFNQAHAAWTAEHPGKQPGLDDIRSMVEAAKGNEKGTLMMIPDGKGGSVAQMVHSGDAVPAGSTTVAGMGAAAKDAGKETKAAQSIVDEADLAHKAAQEAENGNAEGDVDLMLSFFKTIKGSNGSGIRFTQQEQNLIRGARSYAGDLVAIGQKVIGSGQALTHKQREDVLKIIDLHAQQAKNHLSGTGSSATSDKVDWNKYPEVKP